MPSTGAPQPDFESPEEVLATELTLRDTVQVLHRDELRRRSVEIFPAAYVTLLSIVQGIAFGRLTDATYRTIGARKFEFSQEYFQTALECFAVLSAIVVIFYMYVWYVLVLRWTPTIMDTLVPFTLGCVEVGFIGSISHDRSWIVWAWLLQGAGALAFLHSVVRTSESMFLKRQDHSRIRGLLKWLAWISVVFAAITAVLFFGGLLLNIKVALWAVIVETIFMVVAMIVRSEMVLSEVFRDHGIRWYRALESRN